MKSHLKGTRFETLELIEEIVTQELKMVSENAFLKDLLNAYMGVPNIILNVWGGAR